MYTYFNNTIFIISVTSNLCSMSPHFNLYDIEMGLICCTDRNIERAIKTRWHDALNEL